MVEGMKFTNDHVERIFLEFWSGRVRGRKQFFEVVWGIKVNVRRKRLSPVCLANLDSLFCRYDDFVTSVPGGCSITCKVAESLGRLEGIGGWTPNKNESNVSENDKDANWTLLGLLFVKCYSFESLQVDVSFTSIGEHGACQLAQVWFGGAGGVDRFNLRQWHDDYIVTIYIWWPRFCVITLFILTCSFDYGCNLDDKNVTEVTGLATPKKYLNTFSRQFGHLKVP
jgi:hypothetical protein